MGTTTIPPGDWEFDPDSKLPQKAQSVLVIGTTSTVLSFLAVQFYWFTWSRVPSARTPFEANLLYLVGPAVLFSVSYGLSFLWFGMRASSESPFKTPSTLLSLLFSYAWAVLGIPAGSVLFNEALTTPRGFLTKICYLIAGSALLAESVVLVHLIQTRISTARKVST